MIKEGEYQSRYEIMFQNTSHGIQLMDRQGNIYESNPAFQRLTGYSKGELAHHSIDDLVPLEDLEAFATGYQQLFTDEIFKFRINSRLIHKSGHVIWVKISASRFTSRKYNEYMVLCSFEDQTLQQDLQEQLAEAQRQTEQIQQDFASHFPANTFIDLTNDLSNAALYLEKANGNVHSHGAEKDGHDNIYKANEILLQALANLKAWQEEKQ